MPVRSTDMRRPGISEGVAQRYERPRRWIQPTCVAVQRANLRSRYQNGHLVVIINTMLILK